METNIVEKIIDKPLFTPHYLNFEYLFSELNKWVQTGLSYVFDSKTWDTVGLISGLLSTFCIAIIIYTIVRAFELRADEKEKIEKEIADALFKKKQEERNANS